MKAENPRILQLLNERLAGELGAIHVYLAHAALAANLDLLRLVEHYREEVSVEQGHAGLLLDRILLLQGTPNLAVISPAEIVAQAGADAVSPDKWPVRDLLLEQAAVAGYQAAAMEARKLGDPATALVFEQLLLQEQAHLNEAEGVLEQIRLMGIQGWVQLQVHPAKG